MPHVQSTVASTLQLWFSLLLLFCCRLWIIKTWGLVFWDTVYSSPNFCFFWDAVCNSLNSIYASYELMSHVQSTVASPMQLQFNLLLCCYRKRHQPTPHYAWLWTLAQAVNRTSGRSGSTSEDDPAERGCSRSRMTLGSTPTMPGGSHMTASLAGRYDPWPAKRSTDWLTFAVDGGS